MDPGAHRPNTPAQQAHAKAMQNQEEDAVINSPTIAPQGMYDPNFNMDEAIRQQTYAGIRGNYIDGNASQQQMAMGSSPQPSATSNIFSGMGSQPTDIFGRQSSI